MSTNQGGRPLASAWTDTTEPDGCADCGAHVERIGTRYVCTGCHADYGPTVTTRAASPLVVSPTICAGCGIAADRPPVVVRCCGRPLCGACRRFRDVEFAPSGITYPECFDCEAQP